MTDAEIRAAYSKACHGAGAEPRWEARRAIDAEIAREGTNLGDFLRKHNLDVGVYFATRPIS